MVFSLLLTFAFASVPQDTSGALLRAEALLASGELEESRSVLNSYLRRTPRDYNALMLLGSVHLEWPVTGRFDAWRTFKLAAEVSPGNPDPFYGQALVGERLGGADGERMIREALLKIWALDPDYPDSWRLWSGVYQGPSQILEAAEVLGRHSETPGLNERLVRMYLNAEDFSRADEVLASMQNAGRNDAILWALKAESAFLQGETDAGVDAYGLALDRVGIETDGVLWSQIEVIASPRELATHAGVETDRALGAFYRAFWEKREPDLTTLVNERIAEHFERLKEARRLYRIRHPQSRYHSSARWRSIAGANVGRVRAVTGQFLRPDGVALNARTESGIAEPDWDVGVREPDSLSRFRRYGLDGRGLVLVRYGEPDERLISGGSQAAGDVESWTYELDGSDRVLVFSRASSYNTFGGDMVFMPTSATERHNSEVMLERDESAIHADIGMDAWVAFFQADDGLGSRVYVRSHPDNSSVRVWDAGWRAVSAATGSGPLVLAAEAGRHTVGIDFRDGDRLARIRREINVPRYSSGRLALSSLLMSQVDGARLDRSTLARMMPARLVFSKDSTFTLYVEIYNLTADNDGNGHYSIDYVFMPEDNSSPVTFSFEKTTPLEGVVPDRLVVQPGRLRPGVYRVIFRVRDLSNNREALQTRVDVRFR